MYNFITLKIRENIILELKNLRAAGDLDLTIEGLRKVLREIEI